jgi:hypothetical protein
MAKNLRKQGRNLRSTTAARGRPFKRQCVSGKAKSEFSLNRMDVKGGEDTQVVVVPPRVTGRDYGASRFDEMYNPKSEPGPYRITKVG